MKFFAVLLACSMLILGLGHADVFAEPRAIHEGVRGVSLSAIADDVIGGKHGVGTERVRSLVATGLTAAQARKVQELVNEMMPAVRHTLPPREAVLTGGWSGHIPEHYGRGSGCTRQQAGIIANAMRSVGATSAWEIEKMLSIVSRESACKSSAVNINARTRDQSFGLCQQNNAPGAAWFQPGNLLAGFDRFAFAGNFSLNAKSCAVMYARCGFLPWRYGAYGCQRPR